MSEVALNYALALALNGNKDKASSVLAKLKDKNINGYISYYNKVKREIGK